MTRGMAHFVIDKMIRGVTPILWVDTIYGNIERYVERYFIPALRQMPKYKWKYRKVINDLKIKGCVCDFRSADKPENIEGFGYALIILNEAGIILKNRRLWEESIRPMILDHKADVIIGGTPKGKWVKSDEIHLFYELFQRGNPRKDLQGAEQSTAEKRNNSNWKSFNFSTYDNPILDPKEIDELAGDISPALRDQEIYGKFIDRIESGIIKGEWWKYYNEEELFRQRIYGVFQSWDTAFKKNEENDYSVCLTWVVAESGYYLRDMFRKRIEYPELKKTAISLFEKYMPDKVVIEDLASGQSLIQEMQRETRIPLIKVRPDKDKTARLNSAAPIVEAGRVFLPAGPDFTREFRNEIEDFPGGENDDIVDAFTQFINEVKLKAGSRDPRIFTKSIKDMRNKRFNRYKK